MQLTCVVPGWHAATLQQTAHRAPQALSGSPEPRHRIDELDLDLIVSADGPACWWSATVQALGLEVAGGHAGGVPAANDWAARTQQAVPAGGLLRVDPVSLQADRDSALLRPAAALALSLDEVSRLVADLNAFLAEDALLLHAPTPTAWYLSGEGLPVCLAPSPDALAFRTLDNAPAEPPEGRVAHVGGSLVGQRALRTLQSEIEMLLHGHPVNLERRASGRPAVTGLHWWGSAADWLHRQPAGLPRPDVLIGEAPFVRAAGAAAGLPCQTEFPSPASLRASNDGQTGDAASLLVIDLSIRRAWLSGDGAALERAREHFVQHRLQPWHEAGATWQLLAEGGWRHRVDQPSRGALAGVRARLQALLGRPKAAGLQGR